MIRVVLDSNVIVSGTIIPRGVPFAILEAWRAGAFRLVSSSIQQAELTDVLSRPKFVQRYGLGPAEIQAILNRVERDAELITPRSTLPISVRDPDDEQILAIALGGNADILVSGDGDLLALSGDPRLGELRVIAPAAFAKELSS